MTDLDGARYVYGIVRMPYTQSMDDLPVALGRAAPTVVSAGGLGAIVGECDGGSRARRADLLAHAELLEAVAQHTDVLPMRFGTVFPSADAVVDEFLRPAHDELSRLLDEVAGAVELQVKLRYVEEEILREVVNGDRRIKRLAERTRNRPPDAAYYERVELGQKIAEAIERERRKDSARLQPLDSIALRSSIGAPGDEHTVVNAAFLVRREDVARFEGLTEQVAAAAAPRMTVRLIGPLPPYSFVDPRTMAVA